MLAIKTNTCLHNSNNRLTRYQHRYFNKMVEVSPKTTKVKTSSTIHNDGAKEMKMGPI